MRVLVSGEPYFSQCRCLCGDKALEKLGWITLPHYYHHHHFWLSLLDASVNSILLHWEKRFDKSDSTWVSCEFQVKTRYKGVVFYSIIYIFFFRMSLKWIGCLAGILWPFQVIKLHCNQLFSLCGSTQPSVAVRFVAVNHIMAWIITRFWWSVSAVISGGYFGTLLCKWLFISQQCAAHRGLGRLMVPTPEGFGRQMSKRKGGRPPLVKVCSWVAGDNILHHKQTINGCWVSIRRAVKPNRHVSNQAPF